MATDVPMAEQLALVNRYSELRTKGDIDAVMGMVTDDIVFESPRKKASGPAEFKDHIKSAPIAESTPAVESNGKPCVRGKKKVGFKTVSVNVNFTVVGTASGPKIQKILIEVS